MKRCDGQQVNAQLDVIEGLFAYVRGYFDVCDLVGFAAEQRHVQRLIAFRDYMTAVADAGDSMAEFLERAHHHNSDSVEGDASLGEKTNRITCDISTLTSASPLSAFMPRCAVP